ncbi:MAG: hypothetical protein ABIP30_04345 [Ferruginibacter sp.]
MLLIVAIEIYVTYYPSTFNKKSNYLKNNLSEIQTVILGSSHNQNSLNPEYLQPYTANLANSGQDVQIDSALFFNYIAKLKSIKKVIIEVDYFTLEEKNDSSYFRIPWYYRFYNIELYPVSLLNKISLYSSSPAFFNKVMIDEINPWKIKYKHNQNGFITNDFPGIMEDLKYDSLQLAITAAERLKDKHTKTSYENFVFNRSKLNSIINYCLSRKIKVVLISNPMYTTYLNNEIAEKKVRKKIYTDSLLEIPGILYFDYEKSNRFNVHDFKNDDHLNSNGAKKFSLIIDSLINRIST